jgi:hypothetical protein
MLALAAAAAAVAVAVWHDGDDRHRLHRHSRAAHTLCLNRVRTRLLRAILPPGAASGSVWHRRVTIGWMDSLRSSLPTRAKLRATTEAVAAVAVAVGSSSMQQHPHHHHHHHHRRRHPLR